jgi:SPP1 family predicted phage head-tail adaptor
VGQGVTAGRLDTRVAFDPPDSTSDGYGGQTAGFDEVASLHRWAEVKYMRGGEGQDAGRLSVKASFKVKVRRDPEILTVNGDWRMRDVETGVKYQIRQIDTFSSRQWVWFVAESGVAV